ncbi:MAG: RHS repeat-associated core domain-containing protein, partial [Caldilineaceae bacterium]|nr:RHS repeat-associated core domain-containing protein [Caldilineaceae bacterium]
YYFFNGQRIALRGPGYLHYLHGDHLGSTVLTTYSSNGTRASERGYYAFGSDRRADGPHLATDYRFTGQKADGTGLYYYNARYYDPVIGQFISPDTIVPEPNQVFGYNRYMYAFGNPLNLVDPTGHCATLSDGKPDENNDAECWQLARTIGNMWDSTDYWQSRYGDVSVWTDHISPSGVDAAFMANELDMFFNSEA